MKKEGVRENTDMKLDKCPRCGKEFWNGIGSSACYACINGSHADPTVKHD